MRVEEFHDLKHVLSEQLDHEWRDPRLIRPDNLLERALPDVAVVMSGVETR